MHWAAIESAWDDLSHRAKMAFSEFGERAFSLDPSGAAFPFYNEMWGWDAPLPASLEKLEGAEGVEAPEGAEGRRDSAEAQLVEQDAKSMSEDEAPAPGEREAPPEPAIPNWTPADAPLRDPQPAPAGDPSPAEPASAPAGPMAIAKAPAPPYDF